MPTTNERTNERTNELIIYFSEKIIYLNIMPPKKTYTRKSPTKKYVKKKRYYKKKKGYLIPKNVQYTPGAVIKRTQRANLCYNSHKTLESSFGVAASHEFRLNSIFDPEFSIGGHQPMGRDQWANLYQAYRVLGAKITAKFYWNGSALVGQPHNVGITFISPNSTTVITDQTQLIERTHNRCIKLLKSNSRDSQTITCYWSAKKYFGKLLAYDHTAVAQMGSDPTYPALAQVWCGTADRTGSSAETVYVDIVIDYLVEFSEPVSLATS